MKRAILAALVVLASAVPAEAQPILIPWRPPAGCSDGQAITYNATTHLWVCGTTGATVTGAANVVLKSDGAGNAVASGATDNGTTFAINTNKFTVTEASGNTSVAGTLATLGSLTAGDTTADTHTVNGNTTFNLPSGGSGFVKLDSTGQERGLKITQSGTEVAAFTASSSTGEVKLGATAAAGTYFTTLWGGGSERARIETDGDVCIGATSCSSKLSVTGTASVSSTATITGLLTATAGVTTPANLTTTGTGDLVSGDALTVAGNSTLGDAATDLTTINGRVYVNTPSGAPTNSQILTRSNSTGAVSVQTFGPDNDSVVFDGYYSSNWIAADTSVAGIHKLSDKLTIWKVSGTSSGSNITSAVSSAISSPLMSFDLLTGAVAVGGSLTVNTDDFVVNTSTHAVSTAGSLTVAGDTTLGNASTDTTTLHGHGAFASDTTPAINSCGVGASVSGTDMGGTVTPGTSASTCTLDFGETWGAAPTCTFTPKGGTDAQLYASSFSTTQFAFHFGYSASVTYIYSCHQ